MAVNAYDLLSEDPTEARSQRGELSYTDKQMNVIRTAGENRDLDVDQVGEETDSSPGYVRNVLERASPDDLKEPPAEAEEADASEEEDIEEEPEEEDEVEAEESGAIRDQVISQIADEYNLEIEDESADGFRGMEIDGEIILESFEIPAHVSISVPAEVMALTSNGEDEDLVEA